MQLLSGANYTLFKYYSHVKWAIVISEKRKASLKLYWKNNREYYRIKAREWNRKTRKKNLLLLRELKLKQGCKDCGYKVHHAALEFDHVRGTKIATISNLLATPSWLKRELKKCEVVCSNCHSIRTHDRLIISQKSNA